MEYYSAIKKNEVLPFAATRMHLEGIMLGEISQRKTKTMWCNLYVEPKKYDKQMNIKKKDADSDIENRLVITSHRETLYG